MHACVNVTAPKIIVSKTIANLKLLCQKLLQDLVHIPNKLVNSKQWYSIGAIGDAPICIK